MRSAFLTLVVAAIGVFLVGCGGGGEGLGGGEDQIRQLNQDFITYFRQERWSKIYDLYSQEFRDRCPHDEFLGQFVMAKAFLGEGEWKDLREETRLVAVENVQIQGQAATAEVTSKFLSEEETTTEYYVKEDGEWRLASDPGTEGCETEGEGEKAPQGPTDVGCGITARRVEQVPELPEGLVALSPSYELDVPSGGGEQGCRLTTISLDTPTQDPSNVAFYTYRDGAWVRLAAAALTNDGTVAEAELEEIPDNLTVLRESR